MIKITIMKIISRQYGCSVRADKNNNGDNIDNAGVGTVIITIKNGRKYRIWR